MRKHVLEECAELEAEGMEKTQAWRQASFRIFGDPPGAHGAGTGAVLEAKTGKQSTILLRFIRVGEHMLMAMVPKAVIYRNASKENVTNRHHCSKCRSQRIFNVEW